MSTMFVCEEMNMFMGDDNPNEGKALLLKSVKHITLQDKLVDHHPGGAIFGMKLSLNAFEAPELGFKFAGYDPAAISQFGLGQRGRRKYSLYGAYVDKRLDVDVAMKTIVEGRLVKVEHDEFSRGDLQGCDYAVSEITHFENYWDDKEKQYYDLWSQIWRVDGVDQRSARRAILRMP